MENSTAWKYGIEREKVTEMEKTKQDRRVAKTRRAIRVAFISLMCEKDLDRITVKEIAERADVDRKTVYNYYDSVNGILDELENEIVSDFEERTKELDYGVEDPLEFFIVLTELLNSNIELYYQLMNIKTNTGLMEKIFSYLREKIEKSLLSSGVVEPQKAALATEFITAGMFFSYRSWFQSNREIPLAEISKGIGTLVTDGINKYLLN